MLHNWTNKFLYWCYAHKKKLNSHLDSFIDLSNLVQNVFTWTFDLNIIINQYIPFIGIYFVFFLLLKEKSIEKSIPFFSSIHMRWSVCSISSQFLSYFYLETIVFFAMLALLINNTNNNNNNKMFLILCEGHNFV